MAWNGAFVGFLLVIGGSGWLTCGGMAKKLFLFDIDGTLIDTGGVGLEAITQAAEEVFGDTAPAFDLAGATDSGLVNQLFHHYEKEHCEELKEVFYQHYLQKLEQKLSAAEPRQCVLARVVDLLEMLHGRDDVELSVLTGNLARGAEVKLRLCGLAGYFSHGAFGDDHHDRNELVPFAWARAKAETGMSFGAAETTVIGDTTRDVDCAKAHDCRVLAVASGHHSDVMLRERGADQVLAGLHEIEAAYHFLTGDCLKG